MPANSAATLGRPCVLSLLSSWSFVLSNRLSARSAARRSTAREGVGGRAPPAGAGLELGAKVGVHFQTERKASSLIGGRLVNQPFWGIRGHEAGSSAGNTFSDRTYREKYLTGGADGFKGVAPQFFFLSPPWGPAPAAPLAHTISKTPRRIGVWGSRVGARLRSSALEDVQDLFELETQLANDLVAL
jgi:hypothetical protein